ncbi:TonB family C-terminal domain-containing protein [Alkalispirochaeta americana]|uniref:TonB family C-terminal domain-containing protein n=1 Tax=Alkalispirochaeta americana TaxID=159291 RepID=A0A1N6W1P9_9SPIO|nr:energy transducer TonB [Alkalispirochaeta americana]SIQ83915.1 TonB family C-terminal domain-containing protein [Alkalispirochaeta americana]
MGPIRLPSSDRARFALALALALVLHGVLFFLFPSLDARDMEVLEPPLYVTFDPLPEVPPQEPSPDPEEEPPPPPPEDLSPESPLQEEEAPEKKDSPPAPPPSPSPPVPADDPPAPPSAPEPAQPDPVPPPPPPPPPPRERSFDPNALREAPAREDAPRVEQEIAELYQWQQEFQETLAAHDQEQQERLSATESLPEQERSALRRSFSEELSRMLAELRQTGEQVVTSADLETPDAVSDQPRDRADSSGISIPAQDRSRDTGSGGRRLRVGGGSPDLQGLALPAGFPPEYPVRVIFSVNARGEVISARLAPPTPSDALNQRIRRAVQEWRFEPSEGSPPVEGSVTIIVETKARQ